MKSVKKKILLFFTCLLFLANAFSQQYKFRTYMVEDGLSQSQLSALCQDQMGMMWLGTRAGGINVYDGRNFKYYTVKNGLVTNVIGAIKEDSSGNMWIGGEGGLTVFDREKFISYPYDSLFPAAEIYSILIDPKGIVWMGTTGGLIRTDASKGLSNLRFTSYTTKNGLPNDTVTSLLIDDAGKLWAGTHNGVCKLEFISSSPGKPQVTLFNEKRGLVYKIVTSMMQDKNGTFWFGTTSGITKYVPANPGMPEKITSFTEKEGMSDDYIQCIAEDRKGDIWLGTYLGGVIRMISTPSRTEFISYTIQEGLSDNYVGAILEDREGNIWLGSYNGLSVYSSSRFIIYTDKNGLLNNTVWSIAGDQDGNLWIGSDLGVSKFVVNNKKYGSSYEFINFTKKDGLSGAYITSLIQDSKGNMWMGGRREALMLDPVSASKGIPRFKKFGPKEGLIPRLVTCLKEDSKGNIWIGGYGGLNRFDGKVLVSDDPVINHFKGIDVSAVLEDRKGNFWFATSEGVHFFDGEKFIVFGKKDGMASDEASGILEDEYGRLWFNSSESGVSMYDGKKFIVFNEENGLNSNTVFLSVFDNKGGLWLGSNKGVDRLDVVEFSKSGQIEVRHFAKDEGFTSIECNQNAVYKDMNGNLWFGTVKGVIKYVPQEDFINEAPPLTHITALKLFYRDVNWKEYTDQIDRFSRLPVSLSLPYEKNYVTFHYTGLCYTNPDKVQYQYMLEGLDKDWSPVTGETYATFANLSPGKYKFMVKACNNDEIWNKEPTVFAFTVVPPFWMTWWFYTLCGLVLVTGGYGFIKLREQNLLKTKRILEEQVRVRTKQLNDQNLKLEGAYRDIRDSIHYAKRIQEAILPDKKSIYDTFPESFILYKPRDIVSGDFYWFAKRGQRLLVAAVDCTGHGVPGAFMSMIGNDLLNDIVLEKGIIKPSQVLEYLDEGVRNALKQDSSVDNKDGMDIALCAIDPTTSEVEFAGAYRPLYVVQNKQLKEIKADKQPIGGPKDDRQIRFTNHLLKLGKGDTLYMFSDGYVDQFGGEKGRRERKFMARRFRSLLLDIQSYTKRDQEQILERTFEEWRGNLEQIDDVLVIGISF